MRKDFDHGNTSRILVTVMNKSFLEKLKAVRLGDILAVFLFILAWPIAYFYRKRRKHIWLLCEYGAEARDNAYYLFRYLRTEHPEIDAVYALDKNSIDRDRVTPLGEVVRYGSLKHWVYYLSAEVNISSQKGGKPNAAVCYVLEVLTGILKNTRVFLQHGIIKDDLPFLHYEKTKMSMFMCSTQREFDFVRENFGYPEGAVVLTGLCRYDNLTDTSAGATIGLMPTWREWLFQTHEMSAVEGTTDFEQTVFFQMWSGLIRELLERYRDTDVKLVLCLHRNLQQYNHHFEKLSDKLEVVNLENGDVIDVLKSASCLITDYSSVAIDFAYLRKPLAYYQADYEQFRKHHLPEGYFDYEKDGFGQVCYSQEDMLRWVEGCVKSGFTPEPQYLQKVENFFTFHDRKYCERNYQAIKGLLEQKTNGER